MDFQISQNDQAANAIEREIVPAGTHLMEIKAAEEKTNEYKRCDENPEGHVLALRLATNTGNYKFVFDDLPQHLGWRAQQLAAACGIGQGNGVVSIKPDDLIGQVVNVEISHYTSKAGKVSAVVKKYLPAPAAAAAANKPKAIASARRSPAAKVAAESDEYIPF